MKNKDASMTIKISSEHRELLKELAQEESCSVSDLIVSRTLNIPLKKEETKQYITRKKYIPKRKKSL